MDDMPNNLDDMIKEANQLNIERLANDPEWTNKEWYHIHTLIEAFAVGIITSYPYYRNYELPSNFEKVMKHMAQGIETEFNNKIVVQVGLLKMRGVYKRLAMANSDYIAWNAIGNPGDGIHCVSRETSTPTEPSFIDLTVPPHNAVLHLRSHTRECKKFDEEFNKLYPNNKINLK